MAEAERIEVVFREDAGARLASMSWFEKAAMPPWEYRLARVVLVFSLILFAGAVVWAVAFFFGFNIRAALALGAMAAVLAGCWPDTAAMRADAARIDGWWRAGGTPL